MSIEVFTARSQVNNLKQPVAKTYGPKQNPKTTPVKISDFNQAKYVIKRVGGITHKLTMMALLRSLTTDSELVYINIDQNTLFDWCRKTYSPINLKEMDGVSKDDLFTAFCSVGHNQIYKDIYSGTYVRFRKVKNILRYVNVGADKVSCAFDVNELKKLQLTQKGIDLLDEVYSGKDLPSIWNYAKKDSPVKPEIPSADEIIMEKKLNELTEQLNSVKEQLTTEKKMMKVAEDVFESGKLMIQGLERQVAEAQVMLSQAYSQGKIEGQTEASFLASMMMTSFINM